MMPLALEIAESTSNSELPVVNRRWPPLRSVASASLLLGCAILVLKARSAGEADFAGTMLHGSIADKSELRSVNGAGCGAGPDLDGQNVDKIIASTGPAHILILANPAMRCTVSIKAALDSKGMNYTFKEFDTPFQYQKGASAVWDWLHCMYSDDETSGAIMHSYVFKGQHFQGNGFTAAAKVQSGALTGTAQVPCKTRFKDEADVLAHFQANADNKVLLFGWLSCPCTGYAQSRLAGGKICYEGRTWADPSSRLMAYLQCKEQKPEDHSFLYFRNAEGSWEFKGNGFQFAESAMSQHKLSALVKTSKAATNCRHANVKVNVYGTPLEECRANKGDLMGSWQDDGTCSEQIGGVHEICIEQLPADFSTETHQSAWSKERKDKRHCVCVGAWSLYVTDSAKHTENAAKIMPHCSAIPETALTARYLQNWKNWNGYAADIVRGVGVLVERCLKQASDKKLKCGLKVRFEDLQEKVSDLNSTHPEIKALEDQLGKLACE